ncbi:tetratricopeptide repeat protein [uncultured Sphingobacterium sp.]|uniref:tetratricopeptide repeat protein n=1 Tax=uncultured Sphingobacterium sp. TaxID=182688 RepID=UPI0025DD0894|nr:tetratricopeptide repeat protein [uncultured Sphingobacterium sp.]
MRMTKYWFYILTTLTIFMNIPRRAVAQNAEKDYTGAIKKYDASFKGIGPEVYFLPPPKTANEILAENYAEKKSFSKEIARQLLLQRLLLQLRSTNNLGHFNYLMNPMPATANAWNDAIEGQKKAENWTAGYALANEAALFSIKNNDSSNASAFLYQALSLANRTDNRDDIATINLNISNFQLYSGDFERAEESAQNYHTYVMKSKSYVEQANAWLLIAMARAGQGKYKTAENNIIRSAIPLFNKAKAYEGKIFAWEMLAEIYFNQHKYTEAQWFLLQARDLANAKKLRSELAEIEYLLASSKQKDGNFKVAIKEFVQAAELAADENNKQLSLAILDKLGEVYLVLKDYPSADQTYKAYTQLKNELYK